MVIIAYPCQRLNVSLNDLYNFSRLWSTDTIFIQIHSKVSQINLALLVNRWFNNEMFLLMPISSLHSTGGGRFPMALFSVICRAAIMKFTARGWLISATWACMQEWGKEVSLTLWILYDERLDKEIQAMKPFSWCFYEITWCCSGGRYWCLYWLKEGWNSPDNIVYMEVWLSLHVLVFLWDWIS